VSQPAAGIVVMVCALIFNIWHVGNLKRSMKRTESQLIATEYLHFVSDTYVYIGVLLSFILARFTSGLFWDPLITLFIVLYLIVSVVSLFMSSLTELLDMQLPDEILQEIDKAIRTYHPNVIDYHDLRTRKVGLTKFIEFPMVLPVVIEV
jgi:cation diffusion facilitator family transporter